jgi:hypothetical protein
MRSVASKSRGFVASRSFGLNRNNRQRQMVEVVTREIAIVRTLATLSKRICASRSVLRPDGTRDRENSPLRRQFTAGKKSLDSRASVETLSTHRRRRRARFFCLAQVSTTIGEATPRHLDRKKVIDNRRSFLFTAAIKRAAQFLYPPCGKTRR